MPMCPMRSGAHDSPFKIGSRAHSSPHLTSPHRCCVALSRRTLIELRVLVGLSARTRAPASLAVLCSARRDASADLGDDSRGHVPRSFMPFARAGLRLASVPLCREKAKVSSVHRRIYCTCIAANRHGM